MSPGAVKELGVLLLSDRGLHLVDSLLHKHAVLHIENPVCVALKFWVVRNHHACGPRMLALPTGSHAVNVEEQVHDRYFLIIVIEKLLTCGS